MSVASGIRRAAVALLLAAAAGCGGSRPQSGDNPGGPSTDPTVSGTERIAWDQDLSGEPAGSFGFVIYVDSVRTTLTNTACELKNGNPGALSCSAALPRMTAGRHVLQLAAVRQIGVGAIEGERSPPFAVTVTAGSVDVRADATPEPPAAGGEAAGASAPPAADSAAEPRGFGIDVVTRDVRDVVDVAVSPEGDIVVAERRGEIRILRNGAFLAEPALTLRAPNREPGSIALLSMALDRDYAHTRRIHFLYAVTSPDGVTYHAARGREIGGRIGEIATIMNAGPAATARSGRVRIAPDGKIFVGVPNAASRRGDTDASHLYRLNDDGSTPADSVRPDRTVAELPALTDLDWGGAGNTLHVLTRAASAPALMGIDGRSGAATEPLYRWTASGRPTAMAWYGATRLSELSDRMLIGTGSGILQAIDVSPRRQPAVDVPLGGIGPVMALAVAPDGTVVIAAAAPRRVQSGAGGADTDLGDFILRLRSRKGDK